MIVQEVIEKGLIHTYSDNGKKLIQNETGIVYDEAIDVPNKYTYTETDEDVEPMEEEREEIEGMDVSKNITESLVGD